MAMLTALALTSMVSAGLVLVLDLVLGSLAAALLHSVVVEVRRRSARERALDAARFAEHARGRAREHLAFATAMGSQLRAARSAAEQWGARARELETRLGEAQLELAQVRDALWISEAAEKRGRAALVIAEQTQEQGRHLRPA
jgi:hypothetical protein